MLLPGSVKNVVGDAGALPRSASAPGVFVFLVVLLAGVAGSIVTGMAIPGIAGAIVGVYFLFSILVAK